VIAIYVHLLTTLTGGRVYECMHFSVRRRGVHADLWWLHAAYGGASVDVTLLQHRPLSRREDGVRSAPL
jgi:hypothetical protein